MMLSRKFLSFILALSLTSGALLSTSAQAGFLTGLAVGGAVGGLGMIGLPYAVAGYQRLKYNFVNGVCYTSGGWVCRNPYYPYAYPGVAPYNAYYNPYTYYRPF